MSPCLRSARRRFGPAAGPAPALATVAPGRRPAQRGAAPPIVPTRDPVAVPGRRRLRRIAALAALLSVAVATVPARAEITVALSAEHIDVTTGFTGADLVVFGATAAPLGPRDDVLIVVRGAPRAIVVRQKERMAGLIWADGATARYPAAPGFYAVAGTRPPPDVLPPAVRRAEAIGLDALTFPEEAMADAGFRAALLRIEAAAGLWLEQPTAVTVEPGGRLFHLRVPLPAAVPTGDYRVDVLEVRGGRIVARAERPFRVERVGVADEVTRLARQRPALYGVACVLAAGLAGWAGSIVFRRG